MEMKKQKKIIGGMILVLAVTACASFFKSAAEEIAQEETSEIYQNEIKTIYTEAYQDEVETQIEEEKSSGAYTEDNMLIKENPYGTNTLSLYVYFTTQEPVSVSYNVSVPDLSIGDFSQTPEGEGRFDTEHEFQVMGLIPEECNTITFTLTKEDGSVEIYSYVHEMGELSGKEEIQLKQTEAAKGSETVSDGLYVVLGNDSDEEDFMYYYDNSGVLRGEIPLIGYRSHRLLFRDDCMYYSISESKIAAVNHLEKQRRFMIRVHTVFIMIMCLMMMEICLFWQQTLKATVWKIKLFRLIRRQVKLAVCSIWESYFLIIKKNVRKMKMENWIGYI